VAETLYLVLAWTIVGLYGVTGVLAFTAGRWRQGVIAILFAIANGLIFGGE